MVGTNAARAQVDGVELEWRRAIDGHFSLDGFIANNRARFSSYSSRNPGITGSQTLDLRGNLLPNAPKWTGKMGAQYQTEAFDGSDRKSVVEGKRVSVRVDLGGRRIIKKNRANDTTRTDNHMRQHAINVSSTSDHKHEK